MQKARLSAQGGQTGLFFYKEKKMKLLCFIFLINCFSVFNADAQLFFFRYNEGDKYRIISTVNEEVFLDNELHHRAEILNRIAVEVTNASSEKGYLKAIFQTSEKTTDTSINSFQWAREYKSEFERDRLGYMTIGREFFMPVVRNVPVFPDKEIFPGDKWISEGHEVHDFSDNFGIREPYRIPFTANYEYLGEREWKGKTYPAFSVNYQINLRPPRAVSGRIWPRSIRAVSNQVLFWDLELGQNVAYYENFQYRFELSNGRTIEFKGNAEAEIIESSFMNKEKLAEEITEEIKRLEIPDVTVHIVDEGISLRLDNIQFLPDSTDMLPGEAEKLNKILEILQQYSDRDIMVGGHAARAGTKEGQMKLSTQRAALIADYIIKNNVRRPERIVVHGYGAERPIANNITEEGRRLNRRVEIILLEN